MRELCANLLALLEAHWVLCAVVGLVLVLTILPNTATISSPKDAFYNLCFCFAVVLLGNSLTVCPYIK